VPPLAAAGIFVARAQWALAQGAFLLVFANVVAIQVGASVALWACGHRGGPRRQHGLATPLRREVWSMLLLLALVAALGLHGANLIARQHYEAGVRQGLRAALAQWPEARLDDVLFTSPDGRDRVTAVVRSPTRFTPGEVGTMATRLPRGPYGSVTQLQLRHVEVDVVGDGG